MVLVVPLAGAATQDGKASLAEEKEKKKKRGIHLCLETYRRVHYTALKHNGDTDG